MAQIQDPQDVLKLFHNATEERFWGSFIFTFQAGKLVLLKKESTIKVEGIKFDNPRA